MNAIFSNLVVSLQLAYSISGLTGGIMLSLFLAGFFIPRANAKVNCLAVVIFPVTIHDPDWLY